MTLVAAFIDDGCPVLLGDLVTSAPGKITSGDRSLTNLPIWQRPDINISVDGDYRLAGMAQKVVIVSDRLCLAWTGPVYRADALLRYLREAEQANPDGSLVDLFNAYPREDYGDLEMVAFAYEPGGFRWFTSPAMLMMEYGPFKKVCAGGSGRPAFLQLLDGANFNLHKRAIPNVYSDWVTLGLGIVGQLMSKQRGLGFGLEQGWGGGFELAYYDHTRSRFTKIDNVLYLDWGVTEIAPLEYAIALLDPFIFQWSVGEETAFWSDTPGNSTDLHVVGPPWLKGNPFPFTIPPPPMTFTPDYILNFCRRRDADGTGGFGCYVRSSSAQEGRMAQINTHVATPQGTKTNIVLGNSLAVEISDEFVPNEGKVVEYRVYGAKMPWPPVGDFILEEGELPGDE